MGHDIIMKPKTRPLTIFLLKTGRTGPDSLRDPAQVNKHKVKLDPKTETAQGRPISGLERAPFYGCLVCDLTPKLRDMAETASLYKTPDGMGYFGYNPNVQMYIQVLSFGKVIGDAKKRNAILFDKLNIPLDNGSAFAKGAGL